MRTNRFLRVSKFLLFGLAFLTIVGYVVMRLWNWLTPALFGWHVITFWQALGVLILSKILFGGFRGGPRRGGPLRGWYWRRRMIERWDKMTPEERDKFRETMRRGCGPFTSRANETK